MNTVVKDTEFFKCSACKSTLLYSHFGYKTGGERYRTCGRCRNKRNKRNKNPDITNIEVETYKAEHFKQVLGLLDERIKSRNEKPRVEIFDPDTMEYYYDGDGEFDLDPLDFI